MNRASSLLASVSAALVLAACGGGDVVVLAQLDRPATADAAAEPITLRDVEVFLLPYDRDFIFDSLEAAYPEPEPPIPDTLLELQTAIAESQQQWQQAEARWGELRERAQRMATEMDAMDRREARYVAMFQDFQDVERDLNAAERQRDAAFERFDELQRRFTAQAQEIAMLRDAWADAAFADVDYVIEERLKALRRDELADTTSVEGTVRFRAKPGRWWVHARHALPYEELYWNVPIEVARGETVELRLGRANAEIRPRL